MTERVIKFRAWDKINEVMKENVHLLDSFNEYLARPKEWDCMQFTGLKDVYEGDIIKSTVHGWTATIVFNKGSFGYFDTVGQWIALCTWTDLQWLEVIGTIHTEKP